MQNKLGASNKYEPTEHAKYLENFIILVAGI